jgi:hypothetical protein
MMIPGARAASSTDANRSARYAVDSRPMGCRSLSRSVTRPTLVGSMPRSRTLAICPLTAAHHALGVDVGARCLDTRDRGHGLENLLVIDEGTETAVHSEMCSVAENLVAPGLFESVHHREHDDDQPDTRGNSTNTDRRDRGDEDLTSLREEITDRDKPLDGFSHRDETGDRERDHSEHDATGEQSEQRSRRRHSNLADVRRQERRKRTRYESGGRHPKDSFDRRERR